MYQVKLISQVQKDLERLPRNVFNRIVKELTELQNNPRPHGSIKLTQTEGYRVRAGDYRILYRIEDSDKIIYVYRVKHRREVYR